MVGIILAIVLGIALIAFLIILIKERSGEKQLLECFNSGNVIVFGKKGKGKDLLFNKVINKRNVKCYANIPYNKDLCKVKSIKDFSVEPNTWKNLVEGDIKQVKKINEETTDFYISEAGNYLPSQMENTLNKLYPSFPIYYSTSRHLTNSNIHCNTQYLGRVWSKIREQADSYIMALGTFKIFNLLITRYRYYELYNTAISGMLPYKSGVLATSEVKAEAKAHEAKHGIIKDYFIIQKTQNVHYETRYFHKVFYGRRAPNT